MKEAKEKERETLKNEQKNPFSGENSVIVKDKKHKILRRVEGQQPQDHVQVFLLSLWSPHGHISSSYTLFIAKVSLILFFLLLVFVFLFFGGCVSFFLFPCLSLLCSLFLILLFLFPAFSHCVTKKPRSNHRISEMFVLMFRFGACILAVSLGPAKNPYSDQNENGICFIFMVLNNVPKYLFLQ